MFLSSKDLPLQIAFGLMCSYVKEDLKLKNKYFEIIKQSVHKASYSKPGKVSDKRPWISALFLECCNESKLAIDRGASPPFLRHLTHAFHSNLREQAYNSVN